MATDSQTDAQPLGVAPRNARTRLLGIVETMVTAAAIVGIVVVGFSAVSAWRELLSPAIPGSSSTTPLTADTSAPHFPFSHNLDSILSAGFWQAAGGSPRVSMRPVHAEDVEAAFKEFLEQSPSFTGSAMDTRASAAVLTVVRKNLAVDRLKNGQSLYTAASDQGRLAIVSRGDGSAETVVAGCAALRSKDDDGWVLLEILPALLTSAGTEYTHLLPLPSDTTRDCFRTDLKGRTTLELVSLSGISDSLIEGWKQAGWRVEPIAGGEIAAGGYLCSLEGAIVYVFPLTQENKPPRLLLLNISALSAPYLASGPKP